MITNKKRAPTNNHKTKKQAITMSMPPPTVKQQLPEIDEELPPPPLTLVRTDTRSALSVPYKPLSLDLLKAPERPVTRRHKRAMPTSSGDDASSTSHKKKRRTHVRTSVPPKPAWLKPKAGLQDLINIVQFDPTTERAYFDVAECEPPYNTYTAPVIRQMAKKSRQYPQLCMEWNAFGVKAPDGEIIIIQLGGRNAARAATAATIRGDAMFAALRRLGYVKKPSQSFVKDFGYGALKSVELLKNWVDTTELPQETDQRTEDQAHLDPDTADIVLDTDQAMCRQMVSADEQEAVVDHTPVEKEKKQTRKKKARKKKKQQTPESY